MELHSLSERWQFEEEPVFDCTVVIFQHGHQYFWTTSKDRQNDVALDALEPTKIPTEHIFPLYESNLTTFKSSKSRDIFIKRPRLTGYKNSDSISRTLLEEARTCERLLASPHENIARYHGCITENGRIVGLCFDKYAETLGQRRERGIQTSKGCSDQIKAGVKHLHGLGLVHCDLMDENIMFRDLNGDKLVIIDFDSCVEDGAPLPAKRGPVPDGISSAAFFIDLFAMKKYEL